MHPLLAPLAAAMLLASVTTAQSAEQILRDLDSPHYQTQRKAVLAARHTRNAFLLDKLLHLAVRAKHPNILGYACESLGHYRDPRIFEVLKKAAAAGARSGRDGALVGLGLLRDPRGFPILIGALHPPRTRDDAATGLSHLGDRRAAAPLEKLMLEGKGEVSGAVPKALLALDQVHAVDLFFRLMQSDDGFRYPSLHSLLGTVAADDVRNRAKKLLKHKEKSLQLRAIYILGQIANTHIVSVLLTELESSEQGSDRQTATIRALGASRHELAVPQLSRKLRSQDAEQRQSIAEALGKIGHSTATRALVQALRREDEVMVKLQMIQALGLIGSRRAIAELGRHLADESVRQQPPEISTVWPFPNNAPIHATAWWAIEKIRNRGTAPCKISELTTFHSRRPTRSGAILAVQTWWKKHRNLPKYQIRR